MRYHITSNADIYLTQSGEEIRREWATCQLISFGARGPKASGSAPGSRGAGRAGCRPRPGPRRLLTRLPGYVGERLHSDFQAKRN